MDRLRLADRTAQGKARVGRSLSALADAVYPPRCLACPEPTETAIGLCGACWGEVHFLAGPVCDFCGVIVPSARGATTQIICDSCLRNPPGWDRGRAAVGYEGVGRRVVLGLKNRDRLDSLPALARWMTGAGAAILQDDMIIAPIPIHWKRRLSRRYNQAAELGRAVSRRTGMAFAPDLLVKTRPTEPQQGKSWAERQANVEDAYVVPAEQMARAEGAHVLLIDDVMTTGATLGAATEALREAGAAQVSTLVLSRVVLQE